jgi:putative membrane protein
MLLAASALALGFAACAPENPATEATSTGEVAVDNNTVIDTAAVDEGVKNFVEKVAITDMFEIESAKLALERSKVQPVKDFAQMMIDTHSATSAELMPLAAAASIAPPTALDNDHMAKMDELKNAAVEDFDDKYIDQQTDAHGKALGLLNDFASNGKDANLQSFALKTAAAVQVHLDQVKALDKSPADDVTKAPS